MAKLVSVVVNNRQYDVDALNELNAVRIPAPTVSFNGFDCPVLHLDGFDDFFHHNGVDWIVHEDAVGNTVASTIIEKDGVPIHVVCEDYEFVSSFDDEMPYNYLALGLVDQIVQKQYGFQLHEAGVSQDYMPMVVNGVVCFVKSE